MTLQDTLQDTLQAKSHKNCKIHTRQGTCIQPVNAKSCAHTSYLGNDMYGMGMILNKYKKSSNLCQYDYQVCERWEL
ncbi:MAG: hypothetical protein OXC46_02245 [Thaumarchaeota archaeon]|nr:hypothetical protein [Nitrososphaerota archaeon]